MYIDAQSTDGDVPDKGRGQATFELHENNAKQWRWRLRHGNALIIADSGQGYAAKQNVKQGFYGVQTNLPGTPVEETE